MAHEDVFFYFGACKAQALVVGTEEIIEIDGEFLARCFADTYYHLGCNVELDVTDAVTLSISLRDVR